MILGPEERERGYGGGLKSNALRDTEVTVCSTHLTTELGHQPQLPVRIDSEAFRSVQHLVPIPQRLGFSHWGACVVFKSPSGDLNV